jgi:hypothetical protein
MIQLFQKIALFATLVLLVFSACKKAENNNEDCGSTDFFPFMATGHEITYAYEENFGLSNTGDYTHTYGEQDANGNFKVAVTGTPKPSVLDGIDFFYYRPCGDKFLAGLDPGTGADNWQYKANAQKGDYWTYAIGGGNTVTYTVLATDLTVNTLAGASPTAPKSLTANPAPSTPTPFIGPTKLAG